MPQPPQRDAGKAVASVDTERLYGLPIERFVSARDQPSRRNQCNLVFISSTATPASTSARANPKCTLLAPHRRGRRRVDLWTRAAHAPPANGVSARWHAGGRQHGSKPRVADSRKRERG